MAESVVPNVLRIVPVLLQCRGDASLSMVSITFTGLARRGYTFKLDVIQASEMHFDLSHTGMFPYFVFRYSLFYFFTMNWSQSYFFLFSSVQFVFSLSRSGCSLEFTRTKMMYRVNCDVLYSDLCVKITCAASF